MAIKKTRMESMKRIKRNDNNYSEMYNLIEYPLKKSNINIKKYSNLESNNIFEKFECNGGAKNE